MKGTRLSKAYFETEHSARQIRHSTEEPRLSTQPGIEVGLLTGGQDRHYAFGLSMALAARNIRVDVVGSNLVDSPEMHSTIGVRFLNLHGSFEEASASRRLSRTLIAYARLIRYAATAEPRIFHILWNNKIPLFDRTLLMLYYKFLGKMVALTAHNVNADRRDSKDSLLNRLTLKFQYRIADHIFVHTRKMESELLDKFHVRKSAVTIIPFGVNNAVPDTALRPAEARERLGIRSGEKTILFFGAIKPYKGLEYLVAAFQQMAGRERGLRLIIAGESKKGCEEYFSAIEEAISRDSSRERVIQKIEFIPDDEAEVYFKAADVAVLPYKEIFQSGILFLAYSFGLPVIATDVGSFAEDVIEGKTGFVCRPCDPDDLARTLQEYFESDLFMELESRRKEIRDFAFERHSWDVVGDITRSVYSRLLRT